MVNLDDALSRAKAQNLDLVEIVPNAEPPVCRIMDHGKFLFEKKKQHQEARKKQKQTQIQRIFEKAFDF